MAVLSNGGAADRDRCGRPCAVEWNINGETEEPVTCSAALATWKKLRKRLLLLLVLISFPPWPTQLCDGMFFDGTLAVPIEAQRTVHVVFAELERDLLGGSTRLGTELIKRPTKFLVSGFCAVEYLYRCGRESRLCPSMLWRCLRVQALQTLNTVTRNSNRALF